MSASTNPKLCQAQSYESLSSTNSSKASNNMYRQRGPTRALKRSVFMPRQMKSAPQLNVKPNDPVKSVQKTVESCHRFRVQSYQNQLAEAERTIANLMSENRTLRTMHHRQEVSLQKYEAANIDLPKLLNSHAEEVRVWEIKCRNLKNSIRDMQERLPKKESLIYALTDQNKFFTQLNRRKHLEERQRLTQNLKELEEDLALKTKNVEQAVWRWQAELRHVKQQLTMAQKKVRSSVYDLEKSRMQTSVMEKLAQIDLLEADKTENTTKLPIIKENPILTEPSTAEETDAPPIYESNSSRKLSSMQRRMNQQQQLMRRRHVERGDGDANNLTATSLLQQISHSNSNISQAAIENSSVELPLTESSSEYEDNPSTLTEDEETTARFDNNGQQNNIKLKNMMDLTVSDSQLSYIAPTTTTDGSGTEDDCRSIDIQQNSSQLKREISDLRSRINEDLNIRMDSYSRSNVLPNNFRFTDESDADSQFNTNITEIIDVKPTTTSVLNAAPNLRANQLLATLKSDNDKKN